MQWERNTYSLALTHLFCLCGVFFSKTWQEFAVPGALHCATPLWLHWSHFQLQTDLGATTEPAGRALLGAWSGLQTVMTQATKMRGRSVCFLQAGTTSLSILPQNKRVPHEEAAVASSCYKHFERACLFRHVRV